ncbi:MAG: aldo/keto reductase [Cytophagaceae bacterium]|jgi:predicted oxidoreductase|nr:aldo/keto reductase [Cytophagaceae bacterium]
MKRIYLSDSGPKVSNAIYGFWRWSYESDLQLSTMEKIVNVCLELGINTFDHADAYGHYQTERLFGEVIKNKSIQREDVILFSKCGYETHHSPDPAFRIPHYNMSREHILKSVDQSLRNFNTDYIDIFLLHQFDPLADLEETASALHTLVEAKKIKHIGVANFSVFQHQLLSSYLRLPIVTSHLELNLLNTQAIDNGQIDFIRQKYSKPLAWAPLEGGRIHHGSDAQALRVRKKLGEISSKYEINIETCAVAWLTKMGALPIIGSLNEDRIRNAAKAIEVDLERQDWYDLYFTSKGMY